MRACTHGEWGTQTTSQHNILTRNKNSHKRLLCSGRDWNLWSRNPLDLEADALPIEPPRPPHRLFLRLAVTGPFTARRRPVRKETCGHSHGPSRSQTDQRQQRWQSICPNGMNKVVCILYYALISAAARKQRMEVYNIYYILAAACWERSSVRQTDKMMMMMTVHL